MKNIYLILTFLVTFSFAGQAQPDVGRLQAYKIAYLTKKLSLTPQEAQRFWPIYNQYENELRTVRMEKDDEIVKEEKVLNIRKKYNSEFSKALSPEKVNLLFRSEKEFSNIVRKEMIERRNNKREKNPR